MKRPLLLHLIAVCLLIFASDNPLHAQILTNGDFESGGSANGFLVHDYTLINPLNGTSSPGFYARTTDPILMNANYISGGDHTTGTGNMLVFDGSLLANRFFWTTGSTGGAIGGFTAGTTYTFSFWIKSVSNEVTQDDATRANIGVFFVNANNINPANQNFLAPLPTAGWTHIQYSFVATADNVMVRLKTNTPGPVGNDFAVDDFSITEGGLDLQGSYTFINPTCPTTNDGSITVNLVGGALPYSIYTLSGTAAQTNTTGVFSGLGEGTYAFTVADANGQTYAQSNIVLAAPNHLTVSAPVTICAGDSTTLSATGGTGSYVWTANPPDDSLVDTTSATPTVSPGVTTVYTATSGAVSSGVNLIENGDFSQGNTLFTTGYTQVADPNPFGVQAAYDIVTNPANWFTPFASCGDHTTGTGNLMVFDGATDPTGSLPAWSNQNTINVLPNTDYTFSYYVASVSPEDPAKLEVTINGVSLGAPVTAPGATCLWTQVSQNWNSGAATTANIVIYDRNFSSGGNDFALDDLSFKEALTCLYHESVTVTVTPGTTVPTFAPVAAICSGDPLLALPTISNNGISGNWSPALDNTATTTYTFTPTGGQCAATANLTIAVNTPTAPTFATVAPICAGSALSPLPTVSTNGIAGSWSPALDNTATTTYTFTPSAGQCASSASLTIVVNSGATVPVFVPINPICSGAPLAPLPNVSTNGIAGSWSPALDNTATTTYTFTPNAGQCASTVTLTIVVNPAVAPTFNSVAAVCAGEPIAALPTQSLEGINGIWSPAIDNTATTTYTFVPAPDQCATSATLTIAVITTPEFAIAGACDGSHYVLQVAPELADVEYTWFSQSGTAIGDGASITIDSPGVYELEVGRDGCTKRKTLEVTSTACQIQRGISTNHDGLNDFFDLQGFNVAKLEIFNRYGTQVYAQANYRKEWYGQSDSGKELPDGTYFYVIDFADAQPKTGWIYLNREH